MAPRASVFRYSPIPESLMQKNKPKRISHGAGQFIGRWIAADEWATDVALVISRRGETVRVRAIDQSDGEEAEIVGVKRSSAVSLCAAPALSLRRPVLDRGEPSIRPALGADDRDCGFPAPVSAHAL